MTDIETCPAFGCECEYVAKVEAQAAEIEALRDRIEKLLRNVEGHIDDKLAQAAEIERLIKASDGDVGLMHWQGEKIERLEVEIEAYGRSLHLKQTLIEAQAAEISELRAVVDALLQHEASSFFGPDEGKHKRASWRGVIRKAKKARAGKAEQ